MSRSVNVKFLNFTLLLAMQVSNLRLTEIVYLPNLGCLIGIELEGYQNGTYEGFLGIPFAEPPIENLRFANPKPVKPWGNSILNAIREKPMCIQKNYLIGLNAPVQGEEDCLYLNIYRPKCERCNNLPVMVYIHGGGFFSGSPGMDFLGPEYFMDTKRVILVTIAYRLGALGFLSTNDSAMPGNFGLKDQRLALTFIKENIKHFKGDPNKITIFGQSAGAASCHLHMLISNSADLFSKAIIMSGNAIAPYNEPVGDPRSQAYLQGEYAGIENVKDLNTIELTEKLRKLDAITIVESGDKFKHWQIDPVVIFKNVLEDPNDPEAFLTKHPKELIQSAEYKKIPWITGLVPYESAVRTLQIIENENATKEFNENFRYLFKKLLELPDSKNVKNINQNDIIFDQIIDYYMNGVYEINNSTKNQFGKIITDWAFYYPLYKTLEVYLKNSRLNEPPVFMYYFNYEGPYSFSSVFTSKFNRHGVIHCDDLIYLFRIHFMDNFGWKPFELDSKEYKVVTKFIKMFIDFTQAAEQNDISRKIPICNLEMFYNNLNINQICNYRQFNNDTIGNLIISNNNFFNVDDMRFWDNLFL